MKRKEFILREDQLQKIRDEAEGKGIFQNEWMRDLVDAYFEKIKDENIEKIAKIKQWCEAYPLDIFPEPNFKKAARVLKENGMSLDSISASNMRHVLKGIKRIIEEG